MRVFVNHKDKQLKIDATGGRLGSVTSAGQVMFFLSKNYADVIKGWNINFYPEIYHDRKTNFDEGVNITSCGWLDAAKEIAELMKTPCCNECYQKLP
ncbi:hypothetical protein LCGC14_2143530 [marine sediment metagenome]|uniref:Uncharacterized protein n=1 Tax=marine sediment metagenome TaxID=412755 RepID=A0A0F9EJX1_9ZZZZ